MAYDFSLQDVMGNFTGYAPGPAEPTEVNTATTSAVATPEVIEKKTAFVNPNLALKTEPVAPVADQAAYNASIAQQESGGNPNIGFHDRNKSSAYGPYGMTTGAYTDARRVNPSLPEDITKANPEQLTQAQNAFTQQNAGYLKNYGVPVNESTLSAAHLLGAKGLKDYQDTGYLSPAAIKANGGESNLRNIVEARLGGQAGPASGATQQPAIPGEYTGPGIGEGAYQPYTGEGLKMAGATAGQMRQDQGYHSILNSNSQEGIMQLAFDKTNMVPVDVQRAAQDKLYQEGDVQRKINTVNQQIEAIKANPTTQSINRAMNDKDTGSVFKAIFYGLMGAKKKEEEEWDKISPKFSYQGVTLDDGRQVLAKINPNTNETLAAWEGGNPVTDAKTLNDIALRATTGKWQTTAEFFQDKAGNVYQAQHNDRGQTRIVNTKTNAPYTGTESLERLRDTATLNKLAVQQGYRRENFDNSVVAALQKKRGTDVLGALADFESQSTTPLTEEDRMAFIRQYGGYKVPGQTAKTTAPEAAVPPQGGTKVTPVAPNTAAAAGTVPPAQPVVQTAPQPEAAPAPTLTTNKKYGIVDETGTPVRQMGEGDKAFKNRYKQWSDDQEVVRKGQQEAVKKATDVVAGADKIVTDLDKVNDAIFTIQNKKTNFGTLIHGTLPGEQTIGKFFKTEDYVNTQQVLDIVNKVAANNAKMLGTNPTDRDLKFVTSTKPDETWSPRSVEEWLRRSAEGTRRTLDFARQQIQSGGTFIPETPKEAPARTESAPTTNKVRKYNPATGQLE